MQIEAKQIEKLHEILQRQINAHEELRSVLQDQQAAIRRYDAAKLEQLRCRADQLAERIADLENHRQSLTGTGKKLTQLAIELPEPQQSRLLAVAAGLRKVVTEVAALNRINSAAVGRMLSHFDQVYRILSGGAINAAYSAAGKATDSTESAFLVDAVA